MLIRADTFGGDSHNISGYISNIEILSCLENIQGGFLQNRFAWNCFTIAKAHTFVNPLTKLKNSPFLNHLCCCCHEWVYLPVAGTDLVFCFACSEHNPYFHFLYLSCFEYTFTFFFQAVLKHLVFSGNFRCASLWSGWYGNSCSLPAACIDRYWYFIATAVQHTTHRDPASHNCGRGGELAASEFFVSLSLISWGWQRGSFICQA